MPESVPLPLRGELENVRQLERQVSQLAKRASKNLKIDFTGSGKNVESLSQPLGRITGKADEFTKSMEAANARVIAFGASVGILAAVTKSFKVLVSTTIEVEKSLAKINSILNTNVAGLDRLKGQIFDIARNTEQTFDTVAEAALELSRQGLSATEVTKRLNDSLILSRLSGISAADAVGSLTAAVNGFSKSGLTTSEILNKVSAAANKFAVSERDLFEGFKRSASVAQQAGVSLDELGGIITAVQQKTARGGAVIGNSLKTIFTRIGKEESVSLLRDLGVEITNVQGNLLPATQVIENLAKSFDTLSESQQRQVAFKIGGGFQIAPLLAALQDYSEENSIAVKATQTFANATDEAFKKNEVLNKTLSAAIQGTRISVEELANSLGELGVTDVFGGLISSVNNVVKTITDILQGDGIGSQFAKSFVKGVSGLILPAIGIIAVIIGKLSIDLIKFGAESLKTFAGIGNAADRLKSIEERTYQILLNNSDVRKQILAIENSSISVEQKRVLQSELFTKSLLGQKAVLLELQQISSRVAPGIVAGVAGGSKSKVSRSAGGFLPVGAEQKDINSGVGGAPRGAKPVVIPNFAFGNGKKGTMVANSSEFIVPNYAGGGSAVFNQDMVKSMGLPSGAKKINAAGGFIPNFAGLSSLKPTGSRKDDLALLLSRGATVRGQSQKGFGSLNAEETNEALAKSREKAKKAGSKSNLSSNLSVNGRRYGIASIGTDLKGGNETPFDIAPKPLSSFASSSSLSSPTAKALIEQGYDTISFRKVQVKSLQENELQNAVEKNRNRLFDYFLQPLASYGKDLLGGSGLFKGNDLNDATKLIDTKNNKKLFSKGAEGGIFESAVDLITKGISGLPSIGDSETSPFDFEETGSASSELKKAFGFSDALKKADAKRTASTTTVGSVVGKALRDGEESSYIKSLAKRRLKSVAKKASTGYIPNFAMSPVDDAIQREKDAGVPVNQIRINQSGKLRNSQNPNGLAVTNTRDEPTGAIPKNAARGYTPNFASDGSASGGSTEKPAKDATGRLFALSTAAFVLQGAFGSVAEESEGVGKVLGTAAQGLTQLITTLTLFQGLGANLAGEGIAGKIAEKIGKKNKDGGGFGNTLSGILPVVGQLTLGFQVLNTGLKAFDIDIGKKIGTALGFIKTPAQEAAAALDKLNTSALGAIAREGLRGGELKNFAKDINDLLPDTSKLGGGRKEKGISGDAFLQQLTTQAALGAVAELNLPAILSNVEVRTSSIQSGSIGSATTIDTFSSDVIGKLGKESARKLADELVKGFSPESAAKGLRIDRKVIGELSPEQQNAQARLALGFASLAGKETREEINKAFATSDPKLISAAITRGIKESGKSKEFKDLSTKLAKGPLTDEDDIENLAKLTKKGAELLTQEKALAAIKSSVLKIRIKTNLEVAKLLNSSQSELENTILAEKSLTTTADSRKFQLTEILRITKDTTKANQEAADIFSKGIQGSSPIKALLEGNDIKNVSLEAAKGLQDAITKTAAELGRGVKFPELRKGLQDSLSGLNVSETFSEELLDAIDAEINGRGRIVTIQQAQALQQTSLNELIRIGNKDIQTKEDILKRTFDLEDKSAKLRLREKRDSVEIARARRSSRNVSGPSVEDIIFKPREDATLRSADKDERRLDIFKQARDEFREIAKSQGVIGNKDVIEAINKLRSGGSGQTEENLQAASDLINEAAETERAAAKKQAEELFRKTTGILDSQEKQLEKEFGLSEKQGAIVDLQSAVYNKLDGTLNSLISFIGTGTTQSSGDIEAQISELKNKQAVSSGQVVGSTQAQLYDKEYADSVAKVAKLTEELADVKEKESRAGLSGLQTTAKKIELDNKVISAKEDYKKATEEASESLVKIAEIDLSNLNVLTTNGLNQFLEGIKGKQFSIATEPVPAKVPVNLDKNGGNVTSADQFKLDLDANNKAINTAAEKDRLNFGTFAADKQKVIDIEKAASAAELVSAESLFRKNIDILGVKQDIAKQTAKLIEEGASEEDLLDLQLQGEKKIAKIESERLTLREKIASKGVTKEQLGEGLEDTFVRASETFVDNLSDGINEAIVKGGDLGDVLQSVAYDFFATMAKESQKLLLKKLFFGEGDSASGGGGGGGGLIGSIVGAFTGNAKASGGMITGGSGSKDDVPALLMGGEYVMKKNAVNKYGSNFMESINNGKAPKEIQKFAEGGAVIQQDTQEALAPAVQSSASLGNSFSPALATNTFGSGLTSQLPSNVITSEIQQFANGGLVIPEEEKKIQSGDGGFFTPGTYGGGIRGKSNLLNFSTQAFTSGKKDVISSSSNQFGGASSISLEPESVRLTNFGRNQGTPLQRATQEAKGQAFELRGEQIQAEKLYEEQKQAIKDRDKAIIINGLIQIAAIGAGAAAKKFDTGGKAALAADAAADGISQGGNFITRGAKKTKTYIKGGLFGQDVAAPDGSGDSVNVGGLRNLFSAKGNIGSTNGLEQYIKQNPSSKIAQKYAAPSKANSLGGFPANSAIRSASQRPPTGLNFNSPGGSADRALRGLDSLPIQKYSGQPNKGNRFLSKDGLQYKIYDGSRWVDSFKYQGAVTGDYYGSNGPKNFATGGSIPNQAGVDTVPTMLSGGEFVMNSAAANKIGQGNLERMNSGVSGSEESNSESDAKLVSKLDELIAATKESSGEINITVNGSTGEEEEESSGDSSEGSNQMARKLKEEVLKIIKDEKRLGGSLRGGGL